MKTIGFIGAGNMAEALIRKLKGYRIIAFDKTPKRAKYVRIRYKIQVTNSNKEVAEKSDILILAVKPQVISDVAAELALPIKKAPIQSGQLQLSCKLVISIAAGISLNYLEKRLPGLPLIRAMPNNPALVGEGITAIAKGKLANESQLRIAERIFSNVGKTIRVPEKFMDAITALSGSGPGFIYYTLEAMIEAGVAVGLPRPLARDLAIQTMWGSIKTVREVEKSPQELRAMVASPGGTTLAGIKALERHNYKQALISAIIDAKKRAAELRSMYEKSG